MAMYKILLALFKNFHAKKHKGIRTQSVFIEWRVSSHATNKVVTVYYNFNLIPVLKTKPSV